MRRPVLPIALACGVAAAAIAASATAQQVYRYTDPQGRIIYSDRAPPSDAKNVQAKKLTPNFIENSEISLASRQAMERFPVTLYTFAACGEACQNAEGLLNRRGVPFRTVNIEDPKGAEQLKNLTGAVEAPVLQVGDKLIAKGFSEARWQSMLDDAGYPKAPAQRRTSAPARSAEPGPAPKVDEADKPKAGAGYPVVE